MGLKRKKRLFKTKKRRKRKKRKLNFIKEKDLIVLNQFKVKIAPDKKFILKIPIIAQQKLSKCFKFKKKTPKKYLKRLNAILVDLLTVTYFKINRLIIKSPSKSTILIKPEKFNKTLNDYVKVKINFPIILYYNIIIFLDVLELFNLKNTSKLFYQIIDWRDIAFYFQKYIYPPIMKQNELIPIQNENYFKNYVLKTCLIPNFIINENLRKEKYILRREIFDLIKYCRKIFKTVFFYKIIGKWIVIKSTNSKIKGALIRFDGYIFTQAQNSSDYEREPGYNIFIDSFRKIIDYDKKLGKCTGFTTPAIQYKKEIRTSHRASCKKTKYDSEDEEKKFKKTKEYFDLKNNFLVDNDYNENNYEQNGNKEYIPSDREDTLTNEKINKKYRTRNRNYYSSPIKVDKITKKKKKKKKKRTKIRHKKKVKKKMSKIPRVKSQKIKTREEILKERYESQKSMLK